jgi:hypothetical protein
VYSDTDLAHQNQRRFERFVQPFEPGTCLAYARGQARVETEMELLPVCILNSRAFEEGALPSHATAVWVII